MKSHSVYSLGVVSVSQQKVLRFSCVVLCVSGVSHLIAEEYLAVRICHHFIIYSSTEDHLGCFQFGSDINKVAGSICVEMCFCFLLTQVDLPGHSNCVA